MMKALGFVEGQGLGKHGQGIVKPIEQTELVTRQGLGYNSEGTAAALYPLYPDANWEHSVMVDAENELVAHDTAPDQDTVNFMWEAERATSLPEDVRNSKVMHADAFLQLKQARRAALHMLQARPDGATGGLCPHHGVHPCPLIATVVLCCTPLHTATLGWESGALQGHSFCSARGSPSTLTHQCE